MGQLLLILFILVPLLHVISSQRSHGGAKFGWVLLMVFFSWLAYPVFLIMTQKEINKSKFSVREGLVLKVKASHNSLYERYSGTISRRA